DQEKARQLEALYAKAPGVFLHHAGHTHRNKRTFAIDRREVEFLEVAATKEYPGGYSLLRVHTGGYQVSFYKIRTDLGRQWSQRTRAEYFGLYPAYTLGTISDRNHTVVRDLSGRQALACLPRTSCGAAGGGAAGGAGGRGGGGGRARGPGGAPGGAGGRGGGPPPPPGLPARARGRGRGGAGRAAGGPPRPPTPPPGSPPVGPWLASSRI